MSKTDVTKEKPPVPDGFFHVHLYFPEKMRARIQRALPNSGYTSLNAWGQALFGEAVKIALKRKR